MIVTRLELTNVRGVEAAEFRFQPGFNLIIGLNGAGKTTALDGLAQCVGAAARLVNGLRALGSRFDTDDIHGSAPALTVQADMLIDDLPYTYLHHRPRQSAIELSDTGGQRNTPTRSEFIGAVPPMATGSRPRPFGLYFSTRRAVPVISGRTGASSRGHEAAFAEAFAHRQLSIGEFASWIRTRAKLASESSGSARVLEALEQAVTRFLPGYSGLRATDEKVPRLLIQRDGTEISVQQLSDGERGILALVLDLTRRLAQANPDLYDPAAESTGVVLIDEIDLHLHPRWQREIVSRLPEIFPCLQFIATTHSPQVIGEVPADRIQIMGQGPVFSPVHSFGIDSSRVLAEIMDAPPRTARIQEQLADLSQRMATGDLDVARSIIDDLSLKLGYDDPDVLRGRATIDYLTDDE